MLALAADTTPTFRGDSAQLRVQPPRLENPQIRLDARLDEPEWQRSALLTGFTQYNPVEGLPAGEDDTEIYLFYSDDALYFGIRANYSRPEVIRANLGERDQIIFRTDFVRIMLDTQNSQRQAYIFYVNPLGAQGDGYWIEGLETRLPVPIDFNIDFLWDSSGRRTSTGWEAEVRIPYASLRFPDADIQTWGLNIARETRGTGFQWSWAPITAERTNVLAQSGTLVGLEGIRYTPLLEVNPELTGKRLAEAPGGGTLVQGDFTPNLGVNTRFGLTRNLVLDATINPDFSQVEADEGQITINERFALSFPEKRPFFLEGAEIFTTPQRLVYTRAIVDPVGGAKLTGTVGSTSVGYLGVLDESPRSLYGLETQAIFNLLRLRRDVGAEGSTAGVLFADRTLRDGSAANRVAGVDGRLLFGPRITLTSQVAAGWTRAPGVDDRWGTLVHAHLQRAGREFSWEARLEDVHPDFRARSGYLTRIGETRAAGTMRYDWYRPAGSKLERWGNEIRLGSYSARETFWRGGSPAEAQAEVQTELQFRGRTFVTLVLSDGYFDFAPAEYLGYTVRASDGIGTPFQLAQPLSHLRGASLQLRTQRQRGNFTGQVQLREVPIYAEAVRGTELRITPSGQLRPTTGLLFDLSHTHSQIWRSGGEHFSTAQISRIRTQYQFNRALFARAVGQLNHQDRDHLLDYASGFPLLIGGAPSIARDTDRFQYDLLLAYQPSPGTIVYAGWTRQLFADRFSPEGGLLPIGEGLFLKVSYLWRR